MWILTNKIVPEKHTIYNKNLELGKAQLYLC